VQRIQEQLQQRRSTVKNAVTRGMSALCCLTATTACGSPDFGNEDLVDQGSEESVTSEPLSAQSGSFWRAKPGSAVTQIQVCFEPGWSATEKSNIQAFATAWERGGVDFTWWNDCVSICPPLFPCTSMPGIHLYKGDECSVHTNLGTELDGVPFGIELTASPNKHCVVHELGHGLGFPHEQERTDNTDCDEDQTQSEPDTGITGYDRNSIMSYCGPNNGTLTANDIEGLKGIYGATGSTIPYKNGPEDSLHVTPEGTLSGSRIALRAASGHFLRARFNGGDVDANQGHVRGGQQLKISDASGNNYPTVFYHDVVRIESRDGRFLRALTSSNNWSVDLSTIDGSWERWVIVNANDPNKTGPVRINEEVAFRSVHGRYLYRQGDNGNVRAHNTAIQSLEKWRILWLPFGEDV
jgi:hypothetical protein